MFWLAISMKAHSVNRVPKYKKNKTILKKTYIQIGTAILGKNMFSKWSKIGLMAQEIM